MISLAYSQTCNFEFFWFALNDFAMECTEETSRRDEHRTIGKRQIALFDSLEIIARKTRLKRTYTERERKSVQSVSVTE